MTIAVIKIIEEWGRDWIGRSSITEEGDVSKSPFQALGAALGVVAVIFSDTLMGAVAEGASAAAVDLIRIGILLLLILMAHHTVVAKAHIEQNGSDRLVYRYRYSQFNRLISKFVALVAVAFVVWLLWPQPVPCALSVSVSGDRSAPILYLEISGKNENEIARVPLSSDKTALLKIPPDQVEHWSLTLIDNDGKQVKMPTINGCPSKEVDVGNEFGVITLRPS